MNSQESKQIPIIYKVDIFPTIGWNGDVTLLSPEMLGVQSLRHNNFVSGNLHTSGLSDIISASLNSTYLQEYIQGFEACKRSCKHFDYCQGGNASNKHFELHNIAGTETSHCINSQQKPIDAILSLL